jgi:PAS domain S-box-containing protein
MLRRKADRGRGELRIRASQQAALASLGQQALGGMELDDLLDATAAAAARELDADQVVVRERTRDGAGMLARAGAGLPDGVLGGLLPLDAAELSRDLGSRSVIAAPIRAPGRDFGVIEAHSSAEAHFGGDDSHFLQALANVLGAAVERSTLDDLMRDSEAQFRELANTTPALMWMTDAEGDVTFVNEGWLRFTGGGVGGEHDGAFASSAHPDDREALLASWTEALRRQDDFRHEYRLRHEASDGYRWVLELGRPRFAGGEFVGYVGTATDIHERRAMEESLRESEASFRDLANTAPAMIWTTDDQGMITFVNQGWLQFTGTKFHEEMGASWELGVHPDDAALTSSTWVEAQARRGEWQLEYRLHHHSGEYRWISDRGVPRYAGGRYVGYVGAAIDVHERKTMEGRLLEVYEKEHAIAETLQRSLLPERLPPVEGLELAARYLPGARGAAIGGDWYDVLERPDGRVALVVGDVVGHGMRAAASMGQLRNAFRAYGMVEGSPAEVVARINRLVMHGVEQVMATVLYLVLDRESGEVAFSAAGHPPPLLIAPDGPRFLEGGRSVPIGAGDPAVFREATALLPPGSTLLLYTDGLVERRDAPLEGRLEELAAAAADADTDLDGLCEHLLSAVLGETDPADDVALLAVRALPAAARQVSLTLPAEPGSLAVLRRRLARFLQSTGADELQRFEITLTISEAAGNAIEHAYGPGDESFEVEVSFDDGVLTARVRDSGSWRDPRGEHRGRGLQIIEDLMDEVTVERHGDGTHVTMRRRLVRERVA